MWLRATREISGGIVIILRWFLESLPSLLLTPSPIRVSIETPCTNVHVYISTFSTLTVNNCRTVFHHDLLSLTPEFDLSLLVTFAVA